MRRAIIMLATKKDEKQQLRDVCTFATKSTGRTTCMSSNRPPCDGDCNKRYCIRHCQCKLLKVTFKAPSSEVGSSARGYYRVNNCDNCDGNKCARCSRCVRYHCRCLRKTPQQTRTNRDSTLANIKQAIQTPAAVRQALETPRPRILQQLFGTTESKTVDILDQIISVLDIDKSKLRNIPGREILTRKNPIEYIRDEMGNDQRALEQLPQLLGLISSKAAKSILPNDPEWLLDQLHKRLSKDYGIDQDFRNQILEGFARELFSLVDIMPKHTMAYRIARAIIVCQTSQKKLDGNLSDLDPPNFGKKARKKGREDFSRATTEQKDPKKTKRSVSRMSSENVMRIVKHILSCVQSLSWGTKSLKVKGKTEVIMFPRLTRTMPVEVMFSDYAKQEAQMKLAEAGGIEDTTGGTAKKASTQLPQRSSYFKVAASLTSKSEEKMSCIDYVQDNLINSRVSVLQRIIMQLVAPTKHKQMIRYLAIAQNFLKYQFDSHIKDNDNVSTEPHFGVIGILLSHY